MNKKTVTKYIILALVALAVRFGCNFLVGSLSDVAIGPLAGIFLGVPGIIGCALGAFVSKLVLGSGIGISALCMLPAAVAAIIPFFGRRFLKDKSTFLNTWIYFAIIAVTCIGTSLCWLPYDFITMDSFIIWDVMKVYFINYLSISLAFSFPLYFLISGIKERNFKTGNPLLNAYVCWLPFQYICNIFFATKVYSVNISLLNASPVKIYTDWFNVGLYFLVLSVGLLILATLTRRFKRVMLFVFAAIMVAASVFNIISFDTGEGAYILVFLALWLLLHAIFYSWYENKALKKKAVRVITIVLHCIFILTLALVSALDVSTYIIPEANGDENNIIVLGAPVNDNRASDILNERIDLAAEYLLTNEKADAILTGGTKVEGGKTEAEVIRDGLLEKGVSEDRLTLESDAKTTQENFEKSLEIIKSKGGNAEDEMVIVTSSFHLLRSGIYAVKAGFKNLTYLGSNSFYFKDLSWYIREAYSIIPVLFS